MVEDRLKFLLAMLEVPDGVWQYGRRPSIATRYTAGVETYLNAHHVKRDTFATKKSGETSTATRSITPSIASPSNEEIRSLPHTMR